MEPNKLSEFNVKLTNMRLTLASDLEKINSELSVIDSENDARDDADQADSMQQKMLIFQKAETYSKKIKSIEAAESRIKNGTFGVCFSCGDDIAESRLDIIPYVLYCSDCQEDIESNNAMNGNIHNSGNSMSQQ